MSSSANERTLYEILGVTENASLVQIQAAYFGLIRACRPKEEPERYQELNYAREVLIDPQRRGAYDQERQNGARIRVLLDQAALAMERDPQKSLALLKSAVTLAPDMTRPRHLMAQLLMRNRDYPLAERQYRWLINRSLNDEQLRCKLARCLILQGKQGEGEAELRHALSLNPVYHEAQVMLARLYRSQGRTKELITMLEETILNDDEENFGDFNPLLQLLLVYIQLGSKECIAQTIRRLKGVVPPEYLGAAVDAFVYTADHLLQEQAYAAGITLLELTDHFPLDTDSPSSQACQAKLHALRLALEAEQLDGDLFITGPLQDCLHVIYRDTSATGVREAQMEKAMSQLQKAFTETPRELVRHIDYIRREYPLLSADQATFLSQLRDRCQARLEQLQARPAPATTASPSPTPAAPARTGLLGRLLGTR